jgi:hypothetical protein
MIDSPLNAVRDDVNRLALLIGAPPDLLPTFGRTEDGARPHIEFAGSQYHYVIVERGIELERVSSPGRDEILYRTFESVTSQMAWIATAGRRPAGQDPRRIVFDTQLALLGQLSAAWERRLRNQLNEVLRQHPFVDR